MGKVVPAKAPQPKGIYVQGVVARVSICFVDSHGALPRLVESASKGMF